MRAAMTVLKEQFKYFYLVRRLSVYELKSNASANYLGMAWEVIQPAIQIAIYWFVFGFGLRGKAPIAGVDFFHWMLAGIVVWFMISQGILKGTKSIFSKIKILSKMNFPMSVIPNYMVFAQFYPHLLLLGIVLIVMQFLGYTVNIYYLQLPIYMFGALAALFSITLITSTLATIVQDVQKLIQSVMRMLLYLSPILWPPQILGDKFPMIVTIMKLNPFYYIIEGYRRAILGQGWYFIDNWQYSLYFWSLVIVLFIIGAALHVKFRRHFVDFI